MNLGNAIKLRRLNEGLSQVELANLCECSQEHVSQIENNLKEPSMKMLHKISNALEIPLPILMYLSMDIMDIEASKLAAFKIIFPAMDDMPKDYFGVSNEMLIKEMNLAGGL